MLAETSSGALVANDCIVHFLDSALPFGGVGECRLSVLLLITIHHKVFTQCSVPQVIVVWAGTEAATPSTSSATFAVA